MKPIHKAFAQKYVELGLNGTLAYKSIHPKVSNTTASANAVRLLRSASIQAEIASIQAKICEKSDLTVASVINDLVEVKQRCLQRYPVMRGSGKDRRQVRELVVIPETGDEVLADVWQFDSMGANRSLELLGKHLGAFPNKVELSTPNGIQVETHAYDWSLLTLEEKRTLRTLLAKAHRA